MLESDESDESDLMTERTVRRRPTRTAGGRNLYTPRPTSNNVTQAQLASALAKVGEQIRTNSTAISTLGGRVDAVSAQQAKQTAALRKEISDRRKQDTAQNRDVRQKLELLTLLPLLLRAPSKEIKIHSHDDSENGPKEETVKVLVESDNTLNALLPLLLIGGLGGSGGMGGAGGEGGSDNSMMMLLLVLAISGGLSGNKK
jgi:hypothetical protein